MTTPDLAPKSSTEAEAAGCLVLLLALPGMPLLWGWALSVLWAQNAVPLGAPTIGGWQAVGLVCLFSALRLLVVGTGRGTERPTTEAAGRTIALVLVLLVLVGISTAVQP